VAEQPVEDLADRLERERLNADRLYNAALTALDAAVQSLPNLPAAPDVYDAEALPRLNEAWDILPAGPPAFDRTLKGRLRAFIWRIVGPPLEGQRGFNAALVDHLNRNAIAQHQAPQVVGAMADELRRQLQDLVRFESLLVQYLQTITLYVDTRDRSLGGSDVRERLAIAEQRLLALKRDIERRVEPVAVAATGDPRPDVRRTSAVDAASYVGFEDRFRGPRQEISRRVEDYLPVLASASDVVDVGCGRGELLQLLTNHGVTARGVDANQAMVELCRSLGLRVEAGDAVSYLARQPDGSIGGLTAIQVVEHFEPAYLVRFLDAAYRTMRPGAPLILETINPACWMAFFETYIRDLTHQRPLHPDTLRYLVQASGFQQADVQFRQPLGAQDRLDRAASTPDPHAARLAAVINDHADKLNARLFSSMDYAVIARR
jgi:SAM-dependent methyltransferase